MQNVDGRQLSDTNVAAQMWMCGANTIKWLTNHVAALDDVVCLLSIREQNVSDLTGKSNDTQNCYNGNVIFKCTNAGTMCQQKKIVACPALQQRMTPHHIASSYPYKHRMQ
jgi:hypothetical protein